MRRFALAVLLCACASAPAPQRQQATAPAALPATPPPVPPVQPKPTPERMSADTARSTPSGVTFIAPSGWSVLSQGSAVVLEPPEADSHLAIVAVQAKDADEAAAGAWKVYKPEMNRPVRVATDRPAREGGEQRRVYEYETSPSEPANPGRCCSSTPPSKPSSVARPRETWSHRACGPKATSGSRSPGASRTQSMPTGSGR